jgi:UDP-glucose:(heptosyl)LPS alpha-1,3-glucosyltransferase
MSQSLRIALVLNRFESSLGGLESWTESLARWLSRRGHRVSILCFGGAANDPALDLHILDGRGGPLARAAAIAARLAQFSSDIVHDTGTGSQADVFQPQTGSRLVNAACDLAGRGPWFRLRSRLSPNYRRWRREMEILERRQFADPLRLIAVSAMVRDQVAARYGLDPAKIRIIHNGIDTRRFAADRLAPLREPARSKWEVGEAIAFLLVANNFHLKGVDGALRALARLGVAGSGVCLVIAGAGDIGGYEAIARRLGIAGQVRFLGKIDPVEEAYAAADVALQPTHYDACSLSTIEGLASGLPTITTRRNGASELIVPEEQGILLDRSGDVAALADAMGRLLDPDLRRRMGGAARALGQRQDIEANFLAVEDFYRSTLSRRRAGMRTGMGAGT